MYIQRNPDLNRKKIFQPTQNYHTVPHANPKL